MSILFVYNFLEWIVRLAMVPIILRRRYDSSTALAWLSVIFFIPFVGLVAYLFIGENRLARRRLRLHKRFLRSIRSPKQAPHLHEQIVRPTADPAWTPVILQAQRITGMPIIGGNHVELLPDSVEMINRLVADIDRAQHHVHLLFYIFRTDQTGQRVADALTRAAGRGVTCRVLADAAGSRDFFSRKGLARSLRSQGVEVLRMLPAALLRRKLARLDLRNHRKLAVIDGATAYTGSQNIVDAAYGHRKAGHWIDLTGRFIGPIVGQLQTVFLDDWEFETRCKIDSPHLFPPVEARGDIAAQAVPTGPTQQSVELIRVIVAAINAARNRIVITSPYLVPDEPTLLALSMAADRGVRVELVVPRHSDHPLVSAAGRAYFGRLLSAGVHIYQHDGGMLHAKTMTVDDAFALLGSSNLDIRSFYLNFELNVLLYGPAITRQLRDAQMNYVAEASCVDPYLWQQRSAGKQFVENAAALLSPLL